MAKRTFQLASSSKTLVTTLHCICASGSSIPPAVYFPGKSLNAKYSLDLLKNIYLGFSNNGWMQTYHFYAWAANHFPQQIPGKRPVVLLIDGHLSHIDVNTTLFSKSNQIFLFRLPPNTSHLTQPADRRYFNVFKGNWRKVCTKFTFENPGLVVTKRIFAKDFTEALHKTTRPDVIKSSFRFAGIWPFHRNAIDSPLFGPAKVFGTKTDGMKKISPTNAACLDSETPMPMMTSTPKKDNQHQVLNSLQQIEIIANMSRMNLFEKKLQAKYDVEDDALFMAWKVLKM